jgi:hypothetical protein
VLAQEEDQQWDQEKGQETAEQLAPRFLRASALVWQSGSVMVHLLAPVLVPPSEVARLGLGLALELVVASELAQALVQALVLASALQKALA